LRPKSCNSVLPGVLLAGLLGVGALVVETTAADDGAHADIERVGRRSAGQGTVLPVNQVVTPLGRQVDLPGLRPQALALSPHRRPVTAGGPASCWC
jgi:hypothetical protein